MQPFLQNEKGATAIEYAVICALIALACVAGITALGGSNKGLWNNVEREVSAKL